MTTELDNLARDVGRLQLASVQGQADGEAFVKIDREARTVQVVDQSQIGVVRPDDDAAGRLNYNRLAFLESVGAVEIVAVPEARAA